MSQRIVLFMLRRIRTTERIHQLLHARILLAVLCGKEPYASSLFSSPGKTLAILLHPSGRLYAGILQLLLHAGILSVLMVSFEVFDLLDAPGMPAAFEIRLQPNTDHAID